LALFAVGDKTFLEPVCRYFETKRWWIIAMQLLIGGGLAGVALTLPTPFYLQASLAFFWLLAFSSATHDIAADGFYMLALDDSQQSFFVGIRSTFYRLAMITGQGLLIILVRISRTVNRKISLSWSITFFVLSGLFVAFFAYHNFILPYRP